MALKLSDVIKDTRLNAGYILVACVAWISFAQNYQTLVERREQLRDLAAYVLIRDTLKPLEAVSEEFWDPPKEGLTKVVVDHKFYRIVTMHQTLPLKIAAPWDKAAVANLSLHGVDVDGLGNYVTDGMSGYVVSIDSDKHFLPFGNYKVCKCLPDGSPNLEDGSTRPSIFRVIRASAQLEALNGGDEFLGLRSDSTAYTPVGWEKLRPFLLEGGWSDKELDKLSLSDPGIDKPIHEYIVEGWTVHQSVAGLPIPVLLLPIGVGAVVVMASTLLIGSCVSLRQARRNGVTEETGWTMVQFGGSKLERRMKLVASIVLGLGVVAVPVFSEVIVAHMIPRSPVSELPSLWFLAFALLLGDLVLSFAISEQYLLLQAENKQTPLP